MFKDLIIKIYQNILRFSQTAIKCGSQASLGWPTLVLTSYLQSSKLDYFSISSKLKKHHSLCIFCCIIVSLSSQSWFPILDAISGSFLSIILNLTCSLSVSHNRPCCRDRTKQICCIQYCLMQLFKACFFLMNHQEEKIIVQVYF